MLKKSPRVRILKLIHLERTVISKFGVTPFDFVMNFLCNKDKPTSVSANGRSSTQYSSGPGAYVVPHGPWIKTLDFGSGSFNRGVGSCCSGSGYKGIKLEIVI
jgi:hypothetical protein